jgi:hypothetical protein
MVTKEVSRCPLPHCLASYRHSPRKLLSEVSSDVVDDDYYKNYRAFVTSCLLQK